MPLWTTFADTGEDARARARAERDAETTRGAGREAYASELAGLFARIAVIDRDVSRIDAELETAAPHYRTMYEAERDRLLRNRDGLEARTELVRVELKRV